MFVSFVLCDSLATATTARRVVVFFLFFFLFIFFLYVGWKMFSVILFTGFVIATFSFCGWGEPCTAQPLTLGGSFSLLTPGTLVRLSWLGGDLCFSAPWWVPAPVLLCVIALCLAGGAKNMSDACKFYNSTRLNDQLHPRWHRAYETCNVILSNSIILLQVAS